MVGAGLGELDQSIKNEEQCNICRCTLALAANKKKRTLDCGAP